MSRVTGGEVRYGRTVNLGDYNNKKAEVMLTFQLDEGEEHSAAIAKAGAEAIARVTEMLLGKTPVTGVGSPEKTGTEVERQTKEAAAAAITKAEKEAAKERAKAANASAKATQAKAAEVVNEDPGFDEDAVESQPEITQDQMTSAMNRKVAELKTVHGGAAPTLIKALINTFVEPPKKAHDIPQNLRAQFLKKLEELK